VFISNSRHFTLQLSIRRTKVIPLGLYTKGQQPTDNGLQNAYVATLFGSFGANNLFGGGMFVCNIYGNPNSP
jgi:hypothetical protein